MLYFLFAAITAALMMIPGFADFSVLRWLPYSSLEFFVVFVPLAIVLHYSKRLFRSEQAWNFVLEICNVFYLLVFFTNPLQVLFFGFWSYAILQWNLKKPKHFPWQMLFLLLPLLLKSKTHELQFLGLSYATFRAFHLLMDNDLIKTLKFRKYFFFLFYFPAILAGPIDRWPRFQQAIKDSWTLRTREVLPLALQWLGLGLLQKFVGAEALMRYVLPGSMTTWQNKVLGFYGYPLYLYLDFAGYSAMAIGFSLLVGVSLPLNFNKPFLALNPQDFWRRFHITLGEWLRDYFFKPLYRIFSRWPSLASYPLLKQNLALFLTFFLMGVWNGTQWNFLLSGGLFGLFSVVHNSFVFHSKRKGWMLNSSSWKWGSRIVMLHAACLALVIFCAGLWRS